MDYLSYKEVDFFRRSGYYKLENKIPEKDIDILSTLIKNSIDSIRSPLKRDDKGNVVKLFDIFNRHRKFKELFTSEIIINPLKFFLGPNIEFLLNRHNHVSIVTKNSGEKRFHRDVLHWSRPIISVLIYTQDTDPLNGCTEVIPCSHNFPFVDPSGLPYHAGTWLDEFDVYSGYEKQALPIPMKKGEVLLFDGLLFHTAGLNHTSIDRYAITAAYHSSDELLADDWSEKRVLVSGNRHYCGNELNWESN